MKYIIIGGGLAGTMLAARLLEKQQEVLLIDNAYPFAASRVAAGMFNVLTGKNFVKSWLADTLLSSLHKFIQQPLYHTLQKHLHFQPIYRPFVSIEEYNNFTTKCQTDEYQNFTQISYQAIDKELLHNPLGGIWINNCGWLNINGFLEDMLILLRKNPHFAYKKGIVQTGQIDILNRQLRLENEIFSFEQLILCEGGVMNLHSLWQLPVIPNKGETLTIHAPDLNITYPIAGKHYLIPLENQHFVVGATYEWKFEDANPSKVAADILCEHLHTLLQTPFKIVAHKAGIRPTTSDRRPILGTHFHIPYLHTFTGFGTKGVLLSPHFSEVMANYLVDNQALEREYDIKRYEKGNK